MKFADDSLFQMTSVENVMKILSGVDALFCTTEAVYIDSKERYSFQEPVAEEKSLSVKISDITQDVMNCSISISGTNKEDEDYISTLCNKAYCNEDGARLADYLIQIRLDKKVISRVLSHITIPKYSSLNVQIPNCVEIVSIYKVSPFKPIEILVQNNRYGVYENKDIKLPNDTFANSLLRTGSQWFEGQSGYSVLLMHREINPQRKLDTLNQKIIDSFSCFDFSTPIYYSKKEEKNWSDKHDYWWNQIQKMHNNYYIQSHKLNDDWSIISIVNAGYECYRVFLSSKKILFVVRDVDGVWYEVPYIDFHHAPFRDSKVFTRKINREDLTHTVYQYWEQDLSDKEVFNLIFNPWIEAVKNSPLKKLYKKLLTAYNPQEIMTDNFGACNFGQKQLHKLIGVNKYQYRKIVYNAEHRKSYKNIILIKDVFGMNDISTIDNSTFDTWFQLVSNNKIREAIKQVATAWGHDSALKMNKIMRAVKGVEQEEAIKILSDTVKMTSVMNLNEDFAVTRIQSMTELKRTHDALIIQSRHYNFDYSSLSCDWDKRIKSWKDFEYTEEDSKFSVVAPTCYYDIIKEGLALNHCVASYVPDVSAGRTNIVFIRIKDNLTKPFFTAEVTNKKYLRQVHGFGNSRVASAEGLSDFISHWCKKKNIQTDNYDSIL